MKTTGVRLSQYDQNLQDSRRKVFKTTVRSIISLIPTPRYQQLQPEKRFVIFGQGRTGSTLLVDLLRSHPDIQCDGEILHDWKWFPEHHVLKRMERSQKQAYGFKLLSYQLDSVLCFSQPQQFIFWLLDQGFRLIYLQRNNLLKHALSQINARVNQFAVRGEDMNTHRSKKIHIQPDELFWWLKKLQNRQLYEEKVLEDIDCLNLVYENDLINAENWQKSLSQIFEYLSLSPIMTNTNLIKVTPEKVTDLVDNYNELVEMLQPTIYSKFLEEGRS